MKVSPGRLLPIYQGLLNRNSFPSYSTTFVVYNVLDITIRFLQKEPIILSDSFALFLRKMFPGFSPKIFFIRQRPTFPGPRNPSIIGPGGLNFRVRDGNGCCPSGITTEKTDIILSQRTQKIKH